jgi:predicted TIM-barrel fold metal-dependent hydrolase
LIIDLHRHLWSILERYPAARGLAGRSSVRHMDTVSAQSDQVSAEERGAAVIAQMNEADIDKSVVFLGDYGLRLGDAALSVEEENHTIAALARESTGRIVPFAGVDPRRPGALELFRSCLEEYGMRGLKLHPGTGFSPLDPECLPFFDVAGQHGVPVLVHTGPMASPLVSHTSRPVLLDPVAADYPDTVIVLQHAGQRCWWEEAVNVAFWKPNIYLELSMWQWTFAFDPKEFVSRIYRMKQEIGLDRVLFGSDFPGLSQAMGLREWVDVFRNLPGLAAEHGFDITQAEADGILGGNAERLLTGPSPGTAPGRVTT